MNKRSGEIQLGDLPAIGPVAERDLKAKGVNGFYTLFAIYVEKGPADFRTFFTTVVSGASAQNVNDLVTVLEHKKSLFDQI